MKRILLLFMTACLVAACGGSKQVVNPNQDLSRTPLTSTPFGVTYDVPDFEPDTDEYFAAVGIAEGAKARMGVLQQDALTNAQSMIRQKMKHAYKGMISEYTNSMGINSASDIATKIERGGDQIIDAIVNDTQARSIKFSGVDEKGNVTCFVSVRINKKEAADQIASQISEDQELKLRFNEEQFRKRMEEQFKIYKENR